MTLKQPIQLADLPDVSSAITTAQNTADSAYSYAISGYLSVRDVTALRAANVSIYIHAIVSENGGSYSYDADNVAVDDGYNFVAPNTGSGRWVRSADDRFAYTPPAAWYNYGDSTSSSVGASDSAHGWQEVAAAAIGMTFNPSSGPGFVNQARSADQTVDRLPAIFAATPDSNTLYSWMNYINDTYYYNPSIGGSEAAKAISDTAWYAGLLHLSSRFDVNMYHGNSSGITKSAGWSTLSASRCNNGIWTTTQYATIEFDIPAGADTLVLVPAIIDGEHPTIQVQIDNPLPVNTEVSFFEFDLSPPATISTNTQNNTASAWPLTFTDLTRAAGKHVKITVTSSGEEFDLYRVHWFDSTARNNADDPYVMAFGGWLLGTSSDNSYLIELINRQKNIVALLRRFKRNIRWLDLSPVIDRASDLNADNVHPNDSGYSKIAAAAVAAYYSSMNIHLKEENENEWLMNQWALNGPLPINDAVLTYRHGRIVPLSLIDSGSAADPWRNIFYYSSLLGGTTSLVSDWATSGANAQIVNAAYSTYSLASTVADGAGNRIGSQTFDALTNDAAYRTIAVVDVFTKGTTANKRGGYFSWRTQADNVAGSAGRMELHEDKLILKSGVGLGVGNSASASSVGTVTGKFEVFDSSGNSLGYVPIYGSIA